MKEIIDKIRSLPSGKKLCYAVTTGDIVHGYNSSHLNTDELITLADRLAAYEHNERFCPCQIADEPCKSNCACVNPFMSHGCFACARYGSDEQRKDVANHLVMLARNDVHKAYCDPAIATLKGDNNNAG